MIPNIPNLLDYLPNMVLSSEEIDKKINELKAIETWMKMNLMMLQTSIQTLEAQKQFIGGFERIAANSNKTSENTQNNPTENIKKKKTKSTKEDSKTLWSDFISKYNEIISYSIQNFNKTNIEPSKQPNNLRNKQSNKKATKKTKQ